jgi:hypothetical protein
MRSLGRGVLPTVSRLRIAVPFISQKTTSPVVLW